MGEMSKIEEVARALCIEAGEDPDTPTPHNKHADFLWHHYRKSANAAIEALRNANLVYAVLEPRTEADEIAGRREFYGDSGAWLSLWNNAIDAALDDVIVPKPELVPVEVKPVSVHFPGDPNFIMSETVSKVEVWGNGDYTVHFVEPTKAGETYTFGLRLPD